MKKTLVDNVTVQTQVANQVQTNTNLIDRELTNTTHEVEQIGQVLNEKWYNSQVQRELVNRYDVLTNQVLNRVVTDRVITNTNLIDRELTNTTHEVEQIGQVLNEK